MKHTFIVKYNGKIIDEFDVDSPGVLSFGAIQTALNKVDSRLKVEKVTTTCPRCKGNGIEWVMIGEEPEKDMCSVCDGTGEVEDGQ